MGEERGGIEEENGAWGFRENPTSMDLEVRETEVSE